MTTMTHTELQRRLHLEINAVIGGNKDVLADLNRTIAATEQHLTRTGKDADGVSEWIRLKDQLVIAYQAREVV